MKYFFFFLFISTNCFSQNVLKGVLNTRESLPIGSASIQLIAESKTIGYTISDDLGNFEIKFTPDKTLEYYLKITHLNFETKITELKNFNLEKRTQITLDIKNKLLEEVVVQSKLGVAKLKGDTLSYNLKALTTGNEEKLVDVLKKLPGIEINEDGKILSQGKVINDFLVNGKKMFGENHKIATENIDAEMLEGIDLLSNYENFSTLKDIEKSNKSALNIQIKKDYWGKINGNMNLFASPTQRYQANATLLKFNENLNISSIINLNNTGYQALSMKDYFSLNKSVRQELRNNDASSNSLNTNDIPKFLLADDNVNSKQNEFAAFDFAYQNGKKLSANGFSIFTRLNTKEVSQTRKVFFNNSTLTSISESFGSKNELYYNQSKVNFDYKINPNSLLNYTVLFDPNVINSNNRFENNLNTKENEIQQEFKELNFKFGHQFSFINKIASNKLISFNVFQEINKNQDDLSLKANYNLFNLNNNLSQAIIEKNNDFGIYSKLTVKKKDLLYKFTLSYVFENSDFNSTNLYHQNQVGFNSNYLSSDWGIQKTEGKFNYKTKAELRHYFLKFQSEKNEKTYLLPGLQIKYNFSQTHHLLANYNKTIDFYSSKNLNQNPYFENFRTNYLNSSILYSTPLLQNIYSLNYFKFDLYHGIILLFNSSYTSFGNRLSNNSSNSIEYIDINQINTKNQFNWSNSISYEHRISDLKNKFKLGISYIKTNFINQVNLINNTQLTELYGIRSSLLSLFKKDFFNYEIGLNYNIQNFDLSLLKEQNKIKQVNPFISFNGKINTNTTYFIDNSYERYISNEENTSFYNLSFKLNHKHKKMNYWFEGNNILNIKNAKTLKFSSRYNYTSTEITDRLAGFIGFGIGFSIK